MAAVGYNSDFPLVPRGTFRNDQIRLYYW
ncbi:MAG: hypothetical protein RL748_1241, partial [Pseudomonadota bacterium]